MAFVTRVPGVHGPQARRGQSLSVVQAIGVLASVDPAVEPVPGPGFGVVEAGEPLGRSSEDVAPFELLLVLTLSSPAQAASHRTFSRKYGFQRRGMLRR